MTQRPLVVTGEAYAEQLNWCRQEVARPAHAAGSSVSEVPYQQHVPGDSDYRRPVPSPR